MYVMKIGEVCQLNMGQSPDSSSYNGNQEGLPFFQGNADFGDLYPKCRVWCSAPSKIAEKNDILISVRAPIGALNIADTRCCIGRGLAAVRPLESVNIDYIYYFLLAKREYLISQGTGSTFKAISKSVLQELPIILPSISEQEYRVCVLKRLRGIICKHRETLNELDELVKARFVEMFEGKGHPHHTLSSLIQEGASISYGIVQPGDDGTGDVGIVRPVDLCNGKVFIDSIKYIDKKISNAYKKTELSGDELIITVRGTTGLTALTNHRCAGMNVTRGIAVIRYDKCKINPVYLNSYFNTDDAQHYIQEHTKGATLRQINLSDLRIQQVLVPPLEEQDSFAAFVEQVDKSKVVVEMRGKNLTWRERCAKRVNEAFSIPNLSFSRDYGLGICTGKTQAD